MGGTESCNRQKLENGRSNIFEVTGDAEKKKSVKRVSGRVAGKKKKVSHFCEWRTESHNGGKSRDGNLERRNGNFIKNAAIVNVLLKGGPFPVSRLVSRTEAFCQGCLYLGGRETSQKATLTDGASRSTLRVRLLCPGINCCRGNKQPLGGGLSPTNLWAMFK